MENFVELSVVAPCLNEQEVIGEFLHRMVTSCEKTQKSFEILIIDDGSTDATWEKISEFSRRDNRIRGFRLSRNFGHQPALSAGLRECRGKYILLIDADLQDPPELLGDMLAAFAAEEADIIYGQRRSREGTTPLLNFCYKNFYRILGWFSGYAIPPDTGDFRLISRRIADIINAMPEQHRFLRGMFGWMGFRQIAFFYDRKARAAGTPAYTWKKLITLAIDGIMSFSIKPLRLATALAVVLAVVGLLGVGWILLGFTYFNHPPQGWASLMVVFLFVSALQLLVLGVIGEYIGRIFIEQKERPIFVIADTTDSRSY